MTTPAQPSPAVPTKPEVDALLAELLDAPPDARAQTIGASASFTIPQWLTAIADRAAELAIADLSRAEGAARLVVSVADAQGLASVGARARVTLGHVLNYATRFDEALGVLDEASRLGESCGDRFAVARAALVSMHALARLGRFDQAVAAGASSIATFEAINEPVWRAKADVNLGVLKRMRDDPLGALPHFEAARAVFAGAPPILAQIESNRAEALLDLARFSEAESAFESALAAFRAAGAAHAAAIVEGNLADLLSRQGRLERALHHFESARRAMEGTQGAAPAPADLARLLSEEGDALAAIGMDADAVASYQRAIDTLDRAGMPAESARARLGLAAPLERLGRHADADAALSQAITAWNAIPNPTAAARATARRAALLLDTQHAGEAAALLDAIIPALSNRAVDQAAALALRAAVRRTQSSAADALTDATQALAQARALGLHPLICEASHQRSLALADLERWAEALDASLSAIDAAERIRGSLQADRFRAASMQARHGVYEQAMVVLLRRASLGGPAAPADVDLAFEIADRARARALLDLVQGGVELAEQLAVGSTPADADLVRALADTRAAMNALYDRAFNPKETAASPAAGASPGTRPAVMASLEALESRAAELERRLGAVRRFGAISPPPVHAHQARAILAPGEALIEYAAVQGRLHAFVLRPDQPVRIVALAPMAEVAELAHRLSMTIDRAILAAATAQSTSRPTPRADAAATRLLGRLHATLVEPLEPFLVGVTRLLISPHDVLYSIPLHAATSDAGALIERFEVVTVPSASLLWHSRTSPPPKAGGAPLIVGVPDDIAPHMGDEAAAIAARLPTSTLLLGPDATFASFARASENAPLIHLACHGVFPTKNPMQARLRFTDGWVTVRELLALSLPGSVVVLSGCETGRSRVARGDEAYGLGRALLATGAATVVMSLWPVHDQTTRELMERMYQGLGRVYLSGERAQAGAPPVVGGREETEGLFRSLEGSLTGCLAAAQRSLIASGEHPAMWAPFIAMGEPA